MQQYLCLVANMLSEISHLSLETKPLLFYKQKSHIHLHEWQLFYFDGNNINVCS